jgi:hypothetical protein
MDKSRSSLAPSMISRLPVTAELVFDCRNASIGTEAPPPHYAQYLRIRRHEFDPHKRKPQLGTRHETS